MSRARTSVAIHQNEETKNARFYLKCQTKVDSLRLCGQRQHAGETRAPPPQFAHRGREMRHRCVERDHEIEIVEQRAGIWPAHEDTGECA